MTSTDLWLGADGPFKLDPCKTRSRRRGALRSSSAAPTAFRLSTFCARPCSDERRRGCGFIAWLSTGAALLTASVTVPPTPGRPRTPAVPFPSAGQVSRTRWRRVAALPVPPRGKSTTLSVSSSATSHGWLTESRSRSQRFCGRSPAARKPGS